MAFVPLNRVKEYVAKDMSCYVFTDDLKICEYCGRKFLSNSELLFHMAGCVDRIRVLYPKRKEKAETQEELGKWLNSEEENGTKC